MDQSAVTALPDSTGFRLMAVHAHPDDESSKGAATSAAYIAAGAEVLVVSCTGGERGDILNKDADEVAHAHRDLAGLRHQEMANAAQTLGIKQTWLGYVDSGLPEGDPLPPLPFGAFATIPVEIAAVPLVKVIREFRPHVMTTYNEFGGYPHPDHIHTHVISVFAFKAAADPEYHPELGEAWQIPKVYYDNSMNTERFTSLHEAMVERGLESPYTWRLEAAEADPDSWMVRAQRHKNTSRIYASEYFGLRDQALLSHHTQIDPQGFFFAVPRELEKEVYPFEDYTLIESTVETSFPESDLFAGLR